MPSEYIKSYARLNWKNKTEPAINETNLNKMDYALNEIDNRTIELDTMKLDSDRANNMVTDIDVNSKTGIVTVTYYSGSVKSIPTNLNQISTNWDFDTKTQKIIIYLENDDFKEVDLSAFITNYEFADSDTVYFNINEDGTVTAGIVAGSITEDKLQPNFLADIKREVGKAETARTGAENADETAHYYSNLSMSYANGLSGIRDGEESDCAKYYKEKAEEAATRAEQVSDVGIAAEEKAGLVKASDDVNVGIDGTMSVPKLSQLESLINGASSASVADTIQAMVTLLNNAALTDYNVGTNILIKAAGVPDFWISELYSEKTVYAYTNDDSLIEQVNLNGGTLQIGYYGISFLETGKVDLAGYATTGYVSEKADEIKTYTDERISALDKNSVGLGNVENVSVNNQAPTFSQAGTLTNIASGETNSTLWGKVSKAIAELISHISNAAIHITSAERTAWNAKQDASTAITTSNIGSQSVSYAASSGNSSSCTGNSATATTATKLGSSNVGDNLTPIYLNSGTATTCSGYLTHTVYLDTGADVIHNFGEKIVPSDGQVTLFRGLGSDGIGNYSSAIAYRTGDTYAYIQLDYYAPYVYFGAGNGVDINWYRQLDLDALINSGGVYHTTGTASVTADGDTDTTVYFGVTYVRPPAFNFAINDYSGNFSDYLVFTKEVTTTYAVVRFYRRTGSQAASMTFQWSAVGRFD